MSRKQNCCSCCGCDGGEGDEKTPPETIAVNSNARGKVETTLRVAGMDCADEVEALERVFKPLPGVREVRVNLVGGKVTLLHDESVTPEMLIRLVGTTGMHAVREGLGSTGDLERAKRFRQILLVISGVFTGAGLLAGWMRLVPGEWVDALFGAGIVAGGWFIVPKAWRAFRRFSLDMNVLMTVAVAGAVGIHQWSEGAAVMFLFSLSETLEAFSLARARMAVQSLMRLAPETALLEENGVFREVPVAEVPVGSMIAVKSGARIPLDGEVVGGESAVNQAPITGESMPVDKKPGDTVFAGTINGPGSLEIRTTKPCGDTTIAKIIHLVEEAQSQKAKAQRFVDVFARYYTPAVMMGALLVMLLPPLLGQPWLTWFYRGLVLLVIACPCALVISTPVSIVSGLTAMARRGVLIKGGAVLEEIGRLRALAVDKTGTITEGKPRVMQILPVNSADETAILRIAAAIDTHSDHPIAQAVVAHAVERGIPFPRGERYQATSGRGAEAIIDGHHYFVGNHHFAHDLAVCSERVEEILATIEGEAQSAVLVGHKPHEECAGEVLGILVIADAVRPEAYRSIQALHQAGIRKIIMLSGDNQRTADAIARKAGIDEAYGDLMPEEKIARVRAMTAQWRHAGMLGDGVNDAPAMAAAAVGIAMGGGGTDTAIETADVVLMKDDLSKVAEAIRLGQRTVRIIQFNIGFALGIKALFLLLAITGPATLWMAIAADTGATLLVIANALRLLRSRSET